MLNNCCPSTCKGWEAAQAFQLLQSASTQSWDCKKMSLHQAIWNHVLAQDRWACLASLHFMLIGISCN